MSKVLAIIGVITLVLVPLSALALAVVVMDCLTYGNPPGLFKNETWQAIRTLWISE